MEHSTQKPQALNYVWIAGIVFLSCFLLFSLDKEMHSLSDFFKPLNIAAFVVYALPTTLICSMFFLLFHKKYNSLKSRVLALAIGIPCGLGGVIALFLM